MGSDSVVRIANRYGLDSTGIKSRWGTRSYAPIHTASGAHPASCTMATVFFLVVQHLRGDVDQPYPSSTEIKDRVKVALHVLF